MHLRGAAARNRFSVSDASPIQSAQTAASAAGCAGSNALRRPHRHGSHLAGRTRSLDRAKLANDLLGTRHRPSGSRFAGRGVGGESQTAGEHAGMRSKLAFSGFRRSRSEANCSGASTHCRWRGPISRNPICSNPKRGAAPLDDQCVVRSRAGVTAPISSHTSYGMASRRLSTAPASARGRRPV